MAEPLKARLGRVEARLTRIEGMVVILLAAQGASWLGAY